MNESGNMRMSKVIIQFFAHLKKKKRIRYLSQKLHRRKEVLTTKDIKDIIDYHIDLDLLIWLCRDLAEIHIDKLLAQYPELACHIGIWEQNLTRKQMERILTLIRDNSLNIETLLCSSNGERFINSFKEVNDQLLESRKLFEQREVLKLKRPINNHYTKLSIF